jgi:hypothetical protein
VRDNTLQVSRAGSILPENDQSELLHQKRDVDHFKYKQLVEFLFDTN